MPEHATICPLCGGDQEAGTTTFAVDLEFGVVVVRKVPASVCGNCGHAWIADDVAEKLETLVDDARTKQSKIEVAQWQDIAA